MLRVLLGYAMTEHCLPKVYLPKSVESCVVSQVLVSCILGLGKRFRLVILTWGLSALFFYSVIYDVVCARI